MNTEALQFEREVTLRRWTEQHAAELELARAIERTERTLDRLRAELRAKRDERERARQRVEALNRELAAQVRPGRAISGAVG